jgi:SAM-dependent methyltransferase
MTDAPIEATEFKAVYRSAGIYDAVLPPHYYRGAEDVDLVVRLMAEHYGQPRHELCIAEFGCGTGRVTARLAPYARQLVAIDSAPAMLQRFRAPRRAVPIVGRLSCRCCKRGWRVRSTWSARSGR